jgi:hypothetical protein
MVLRSVSLISSLSMAAVIRALSHTKPASARCLYFFSSSAYVISQKSLSADLQLLSRTRTCWKYFSMCNTALIFKYWPFLFEYCRSVLAENVECPTLSLLLIPWIIVSGFVYLKNKGPKTLRALAAIYGDTKEMSWTTWGFSSHQHLLFWLSTFLLNANHASSNKNTTFSILFLSSIEPVIWYHPAVLFIIPYMAMFTFHDTHVLHRSVIN